MNCFFAFVEEQHTPYGIINYRNGGIYMIGNVKDLEKIIVTHESAKDASMKVLVGNNEGWEDHVMREVTVEVGGYTPKHEHPWPHINYFLEGQGELMIDGKVTKVEKGSYSYVSSNTLHQFRNKGNSVFKFICIVPKVGHK